jgi:hypothetical protein
VACPSFLAALGGEEYADFKHRDRVAVEGHSFSIVHQFSAPLAVIHFDNSLHLQSVRH